MGEGGKRWIVGKRYPWGDTITHDDANYDGTGEKDIWKYTSPVGSFAPNGYGLYDMAGNVWEWCADWYDDNYYANSPKSNPTGPSSGQYRVFRGGSWYLTTLTSTFLPVGSWTSVHGQQCWFSLRFRAFCYPLVLYFGCFKQPYGVGWFEERDPTTLMLCWICQPNLLTEAYRIILNDYMIMIYFLLGLYNGSMQYYKEYIGV